MKKYQHKFFQKYLKWRNGNLVTIHFKRDMLYKLLRIKTSTLFEDFILQSLPVVLFSLICLMFYEHGNKQRNIFYEDLNIIFQALDRDLKEAENQNAALLLQINSQSDPAFVELTLKKVLGVVPEGEVKVYFSEKDEGAQQKNVKQTIL